MEFSLELVVLGFVVGLISSLLGLGGSILMIPILPSLLNMDFREVIATSLFTVTLVAFSNVIIFQLKRLVEWKMVLLLFPIISFASFMSARNSHYVDEKVIKILLIVVMMAMVFRLTSKKQLPFKIPGFDSKFFLPFVGLFTGTLAGLIGIGGGIILTPTFMIKQIIPHQKISPTINCLIFFGSLTAVLGYMNTDFSTFPKVGAVHLNLGLMLFASAFVGSLLGIRLNSKISEDLRKKIFSGVLFALSVKLLFV